MTTREAVREIGAELEEAGCPSPRVDAEWLVAHVTGQTRTGLYAHDRPLDADEVARLRPLVARRRKREPLAYVLGEWGFRGLMLAVDSRALIPRPETEMVVERCLALLELVDAPRVLDVGVGSGAIALAIAHERPDARVVATDSSTGALELAGENKLRLGLDGRIELLHGDLLAGAVGPFDLVVSNPPYVTPEELPGLEPELGYEPRDALVGVAGHGRIAAAARDVLRSGGRLVLEVADGQAPSVIDELRGLGYEALAASKDLAGRERVVEAQLP